MDDKISLNFDALKEKINKILTKFNNSEVIIEEIKDWKKILLFLIDDKYRFYISSNGEEMKYYDSYEKQAECIIKMSPENIENLFNQKLGLTEAFRNKEISILGD
ncbi:MAG: SCP2 sterol-binding domain-containing protein, partial [Promethearchaeota archaeon]